MRKYGVALGCILLFAVIMGLSNRPGRSSNGLPVIESDGQYNDSLDLVTRTSQVGVGKFNTGVELDQSDRETCLQDAKIFDNMDAYRPDMEAGYFTAGLLYYLGGDSDTAEARLSQAISDANLPGNIKTFDDRTKIEAVTGDCHHMLSLIYFDRHEYEKALDQANVAIQHFSKREGYYFCRAQAEVQLKKIPEAKSDLVSALKINPNYLPATRLLDFLQH